MKIYVTIKRIDSRNYDIYKISSDYDQLVYEYPNEDIYLLEGEIITNLEEEKSFWDSHIYTGYVRELTFLDPETGNLLKASDLEDIEGVVRGYLIHEYERGILISSNFEEA